MHRIFYDALPNYFIVLDLYDKESECFLSTNKRNEIINELNLSSAPILHTNAFGKISNFSQYIGPSRFKTERWKEKMPSDADMKEVDDSILMEGIYIKIEDDDKVVGRIKFSRPEFEKVRSDGWWDRPFIPNMLREQ